MTADTPVKKTKAKQNAEQGSREPQNILTWLVLLVALIACTGVGYLFWGEQKQESSLQQSLQSYQMQMAALKAQTVQAQGTMQDTMQSSLQKNQQAIQKTLSQLTASKAQADKEITLSSVIYLVRMANLALIINQDPKVATHFLDLAQKRLRNMPSMQSLRAEITSQQEQLITVPDLDVDGVLMQLAGLKKVVMHIPNTPHWTQQVTKPQPMIKENSSLLSDKASADWNTLWSWLKRFMIISHRANDPSALPTPEHFQSVQDNVYLDLSTAQWAVLHNNTTVYQHALTAAADQLKTIQQSDPKMVGQLLSQLEKLSGSNVDPHYPSLDSLVDQVVTMQDQLASGKKQMPAQSPEVLKKNNHTTKSKKTIKPAKPATQEVLA
jgi:uncharacterized protein HemX